MIDPKRMRIRVAVSCACLVGAALLVATPVSALQNGKPGKTTAQLLCEDDYKSCAGKCGPLGAQCDKACNDCHGTCSQELTLCLVSKKNDGTVETGPGATTAEPERKMTPRPGRKRKPRAAERD